MDLIVKEEIELFERVIDAIARGPRRAGPSEADVVKELERIREQLLSGRGAEDRAALMSEMNRQSALLEQLRTSRASAVVNRDSPYFGHMRLNEDGRRWDVCLGRATYVERGVNVVDWRNAPISRLFYRYREGEEFEEPIAGRDRIGVVEARRTVTIREGGLQRIETPEAIYVEDDGDWTRVRRAERKLAAGEGAVLREHAAHAGARQSGGRSFGVAAGGGRIRVDKHLPDIAGLIDPEQFAIISRPSSGLVVIRGTAGSGKTTVALHRIAYLAYHDQGFDSVRSLVIVFSPALRDYVAHVLPALGVERVRVVTFSDWAARVRQAHFPFLPEAVREDAPSVVQRLKQHPLLLEALARQIERTPGPATAEQVVDDWASVLTDDALLATVQADVAPNAFKESELARTCQWSQARVDEIRAWVEGDPESEAALAPEDDAILLRGYQLRIGRLHGRRGTGALAYRHIAVDEVQDFSPIEVRVLLECLDKQRSMTLAGDTQQHVLQEAGFTSWSDFFRHLGLEQTAVDTLRVSYRSTREIVRFALSVLGPLQEDDQPPMTTRSGPPVELFRFTDHGACVAFLADALGSLARSEPHASVALLMPSSEIADLYEKGLEAAEVANLNRVRNHRFRFAPGVEIAPIEQAKGLEFDYVVVVEASMKHYPVTDAARRVLHVGATRAIHQLWLTSVATPSLLCQQHLQSR